MSKAFELVAELLLSGYTADVIDGSWLQWNRKIEDDKWANEVIKQSNLIIDFLINNPSFQTKNINELYTL